MNNKTRKIKILVIALLLAAIVLGMPALSACTTGNTVVVPKGWAGAVTDNNTLYIGSMEGKIAAVSIDNGSLTWTAPLEENQSSGGLFGCSQASSTIAIYGSPSTNGELVYIAGYTGKIYAFSPGKNEPRWIYPRQDTISGSIVGGTVVDGDMLYFGSGNRYVYALSAAAGFKEWEFETGDKVWSTPAVSGDTLYIGTFDKKLYALNTADGSKKWEFDTEGAIASTPVVDGNSVFIGSFDRYLYSVDTATGQENWKFMADNWFWARPVVHNGTIYAGCLDGKVYALNTMTGEKQAEFDLGGPQKILGAINIPDMVSSSPVLVGNSLIVATESGKIYAIDTTDNKQKEIAALGEKVYSPLAAYGNAVFVHTANNILYEVNALTGAVRELNIK